MEFKVFIMLCLTALLNCKQRPSPTASSTKELPEYLFSDYEFALACEQIGTVDKDLLSAIAKRDHTGLMGFETADKVTCIKFLEDQWWFVKNYPKTEVKNGEKKFSHYCNPARKLVDYTCDGSVYFVLKDQIGVYESVKFENGKLAQRGRFSGALCGSQHQTVKLEETLKLAGCGYYKVVNKSLADWLGEVEGMFKVTEAFAYQP